ncbi:hypothetical protein BDN70DRAFT_952211 [Pholiota conissans]|uniref:C2H2-type domain-containing protein n=1 Tax=Pholiota conissans TaxID=109636 RepID=A0A9P5YUU0_9AGAR|nr:hypothetical protein BDN70DRAFT_952211 [Pholiota conissans]
MARSTTSKVSNKTKGGTKKSSTKSKQSPKEKGRPRRRDHSFEGCIVPHCGKSFTRTSDVKRHLSAHKWARKQAAQQQPDESQNQTQLMGNPLQVSSTAANPEKAQGKRIYSGSRKVQGTPMQGKDSVPFDSTMNHPSISWSSSSPSSTPAYVPKIAVTKKKGVGRPRTRNSSAKASKSAAIAYYHAPSMASTSQTDSAAFVDPSDVDDKVISTSEQPLSLPHSHLSPSSSFNIASTSQPFDARELSPLSLFNSLPESLVASSSFDATTTYPRNHPYSFAHDTSWSNSPSTVSSTQPLTGGFSTASAQVYGNSSMMSTPGQQTDVTAPSVPAQFQNFTSESALFQRQDCSVQPPQFSAPAWKGQMMSASSLFSSNRTPSTYEPLAGTQVPSSFSLPSTMHELPSFNTATRLPGRFLSPSSDATTTHTSPLSSGLLDTANAVNPDASSFNAIPSYSSTPHPLSLNTTTLYPVQSVFSSPSSSSSSSMIRTPHSDSCFNTLPFNTTMSYSAQSTFNTPSSSSLFGTAQDYYTPPPFSSQTALPSHQAVWPAQETYPQDDSYRMNAMGPVAGASAHNYDTRAADYNYW